MELYLNIREQTYQGKKLSPYTFLLNESANHHKVFEKQKNVHSYVKEINSFLNQGRRKWDAIQQLILILPQCSTDILAENGEKWLRLCTNVISSKVVPQMKKDACKVISLLLVEIPTIPEVIRSVNNRHGSNLIPHLLKADDEWKRDALQCLYNYAIVFPNHLTPFKKDIEQNMIRNMDTPLGKPSTELVLSSRIYAVTPPSGGNSAKAAIRGSKVSQLISLALTICDRLFENVVEKQSYDREDGKSLLGDMDNASHGQDPTSDIFLNVTRLANIFTSIYEQFAIGSPDNNLTTFKPAQLLSPFLRVLQVEVNPLVKHKGQEHLILALLMPSVHLRAVRVLDLLLSRPCIAYALDEYWGVIRMQMVLTLKASKQCVGAQSSMEKPKSGMLLRTAAYSVLDTLTKISGGSVSACVELVSVIMKDIIPKKDTITLQNTRGTDLTSMTVKGGKKKRKVVSTIDVEHRVVNRKCPPPDQNVVTKAALKLTESICLRAVQSPPAAMKDLYMGLKRLAELIFLQSSRFSQNAYADGSVRARLVHSIVSLCMQPRFYCIPPYMYMMSVLETGMSDPSREVKDACQNGIHTLSFIMANPLIGSAAVFPTGISEKLSDATENMESDSNSDQDDQEINEVMEEQEDHEEEEMQTNSTGTGITQSIKSPEKLNSMTTEEEENIEEDEEEEEVDDKPASPEIEVSEDDSPIESEEEEEIVAPPPKKTKVQKTKKGNNDLSIDEMLATFVDADPD